MLVSIIIPNYNHAAYLKQRIDSVLNQTFQDFELIILDDCSKDNSRDIIEEYGKHPKVSHIIFNEQNSGSTFKQWEKGIQLASGDWIWIAESDDWCEPSLLNNLISGINDNCTIAFCQSLVVNDDGEILWNSTSKFLEQVVPGKIFVSDCMLSGNAIYNASMCIFKKSCFQHISNEFLNYKFCGDWLFWIEVALQGDVFISCKILNYFRKHNKDVSNKAYKNGLFYTEYIALLNNLQGTNVISQQSKINLLVRRYKELLKDNRIDEKKLVEIKKEFYWYFGLNVVNGPTYKLLGRRVYFFLLKNLAFKLFKM